MNSIKLYYVYDPMCSWCWGYRPTLLRLESALQRLDIPFTKVLGGLAPDSDDPMPESMRTAIEGYWRTISSKLGTRFNHDFWKDNTPRRSTYPACRAIISARQYGKENEMNEAIQEAYYLRAMNPSDTDILVKLATEVGLDSTVFEHSLSAPQTHSALLNEISFARSIGGNSFPSWILEQNNHCTQLPLDYKDDHQLLNLIQELFSESH